uniref:cryptic protein-like n=1 Tax=Pristiophorus japonicus TaxID=55135 RepID=UPI00398E7BFE
MFYKVAFDATYMNRIKEYEGKWFSYIGVQYRPLNSGDEIENEICKQFREVPKSNRALILVNSNHLKIGGNISTAEILEDYKKCRSAINKDIRKAKREHERMLTTSPRSAQPPDDRLLQLPVFSPSDATEGGTQVRVRAVTGFLLVLLPFQVVGLGNDCGGDENCDQQISKSAIQKPLGKNPNSLTEFNLFNSKRQEPNSSDTANIIRFIGLTDSKTLDRSCCKNGGTCILGSFCACPVHFIGRYCELDERLKGCGKFLDGQWVLKNCTWCKCSYGRLHCIEAFGKVANCDPDQDDYYGSEHDSLTGDGSSLMLMRCLPVVCLAIAFVL